MEAARCRAEAPTWTATQSLPLHGELIDRRHRNVNGRSTVRRCAGLADWTTIAVDGETPRTVQAANVHRSDQAVTSLRTRDEWCGEFQLQAAPPPV